MERFAEETKMIVPLVMAAQLFALAPQETIAGEKHQLSLGKTEPIPTEILECMKSDRDVNDIIVDLAKSGGRESFHLLKTAGNGLILDRGTIAEIEPKKEDLCKSYPQLEFCHERLKLMLVEKDYAWEIFDYDLDGTIDKATKFCKPENPTFFKSGPNEVCAEYDVADNSKQDQSTLRMFQEIRKKIIDKLRYACSVWKTAKRKGDFLVNEKEK